MSEWENALLSLRRLATTTPPDARVVEELHQFARSLRPPPIPSLKRARSHGSWEPGSSTPPDGNGRQHSVWPRVADARSPSDLQVRRDVKRATVRIGLYDRRDRAFFDLGSGAIVSDHGHILTAAHLFVGPKPRNGSSVTPFSQMYSDGLVPRFRGRSISDAVIAIGVYVSDDEPAVWKYYADLLTPFGLLTAKEGLNLLDLAVLQIRGTLRTEPAGFRPAQTHGFLSETYEILQELPLAFDRGWELPVVLPLGNPQAIATGQPRLAVAGWPSPTGEFAPYFDENNRTLISRNDGYLKTELFVHAASSGGPCIDMQTGCVVGVCSYDNAKHGRGYASFFRKVSLLTPTHGLPTEVIAPSLGPAETGELEASPLTEVGPFEMVPLDDGLLGRLRVTFDVDLMGGALQLSPTPDTNGGGGPGGGSGCGSSGGSGTGSTGSTGSSGLWFDQPADGSFRGSLSPVHALTLSHEERSAASIPAIATHFAFVYPADVDGWGQDSALPGRATATMLDNFRDVGGFIYFAAGGAEPAAAGAAAALSPTSQEHQRRWMLLNGSSLWPCKLIAVTRGVRGLNFRRLLLSDLCHGSHRACYDQLLRDGRLHDVTIEPLLQRRVKKFCWLFPRECIGHSPHDETTMLAGRVRGTVVDGARHWPHGGFAYFYDGADGQHDCIFALATVMSAEAAMLPVNRKR